MDNDTTKDELEQAATAFSAQRVLTDLFPISDKHYRLLLEVAFIEGARWYQGREIAKLEQRLNELKETP